MASPLTDRRRALLTIPLLAALTAPASAAPPASSPAAIRPALHILSDRPLPQPLHGASDIRWASERSVYIALGREGVVEALIESPDAKLMEVIPGESKPGGFWGAARIAASTEHLVAAGFAFSLTWRPLTNSLRKEQGGFDYIADVDAWRDRLLVLAARRDGDKYSPDGAIAWLGSLANDLSDLRPILYDARGAHAPNFANCSAFDLGKVRFLHDGSFLVVPGVQPGAHLYAADGMLIHTWDTTALGIDTDCAGISDETERRLAAHLGPRFAWINQRQVVDEILPLPQGPGLVVRRIEGGTTRWHLVVLRRDGPARMYEIPLQAKGAQLRLQGDVRSGRVAFLLSGTETVVPERAAVPRLALAEAPGE